MLVYIYTHNCFIFHVQPKSHLASVYHVGIPTCLHHRSVSHSAHPLAYHPSPESLTGSQFSDLLH